MIENIKNFVIEHRTLIVVIISVLVIYFLYWWFCCKDRPAANKVKGGGASYLIIKISGDYYKIVGVPLSGESLIVLSEEGERVLGELDGVIRYFYIHFESYIRNQDIDNIMNKYNITKVIKEPCTYFNLENGRTKNTGLALIGSGNLTTFVNDTTIFNFSDIIRRCKENVGGNDEKAVERRRKLDLIVQRYGELKSFVEKHAGFYFDEATFIGQPSVYKYVLAPGEEKDDSPLYRFSTVSQVSMNNSLYTSCNSEIRGWYKPDSVSAAISRCYYLNPKNGNIIDKERREVDNDDFLQNNDIPIDKDNSLDCGIGAASDLEKEDEQWIQENKQQEDILEVPVEEDEGKGMYAGLDEDGEDDDEDYCDKQSKKKKKATKTLLPEKPKKRRVGFQVADVFPANKVISTVLFLLGLLETYINETEPDAEKIGNREKAKLEYFQMMSSFMIYVHLLNICCGVRMTSRWNIKISNAYVYKFIQKVKEERNKEDLFMEEQLKEETGSQIGEMTLHFIDDKTVVKGFVRTLGDVGVSKIINDYTPGYLTRKLAENPEENADEILDVIRNIQKIGDKNVRDFMVKVSSKEGGKKIQEFCYKIIEERAKRDMGIEKDEGKGAECFSVKWEVLDQFMEMQRRVIAYIDDDDNTEENARNGADLFSDCKITDDKQKMKDFLIFINNVSLYHVRNVNFMAKIEKIILRFKNDITNLFSNYEIFKIFRENLRVSLFLSKEKILKIDGPQIESWYSSKRFLFYFQTELGGTIGAREKRGLEKIEDFELFERKRLEGENDAEICKLIRADAVDKFIKYINNEDDHIEINSSIPKSYYETNQMLLDSEKVSLIEYAAFFGSIQIFNYLKSQGANFDKTILKFAVRSGNTELVLAIIDSLGESKINIADAEELLLVIIQCFELDVSVCGASILGEYFHNSEWLDFVRMESSLKYRNYNMYDWECLKKLETILPKYDCYLIMEHVIKGQKIDLECALTNSLMYSSYDVICLIQSSFREKTEYEILTEFVLKKFVEKGLVSNSAKEKIEFFEKAYCLGIDSLQRYSKLNASGRNDDFSKFLKVREREDKLPMDELLKMFGEVETKDSYQEDTTDTKSDSQTSSDTEQLVEIEDEDFIDYIIDVSGHDPSDKQKMLYSFRSLTDENKSFYKRLKKMPVDVMIFRQIQWLCDDLSNKQPEPPATLKEITEEKTKWGCNIV